MWAHYIYLLLLPTLAVIAAGMMFPDSDFWLQLLIFGFPPVLMYSLFLANGYAIPNSLPVALIVVLSIPLQIGLSVLLFGSGSVWLFFAESAAVEIGAFVLGVLTIAMMRRRQDMARRPSDEGENRRSTRGYCDQSVAYVAGTVVRPPHRSRWDQ